VTKDLTQRPRGLSDIASVTAIVASVVLAFALLGAIVWIASRALIIIFGGMLLAVLLDAGARGLGHILGWGRRLRLFIILLVALALVAGALALGGSVLASQASNFIAATRDLFDRFNEFVRSGGFDFIPESIEASTILPNGTVLLGEAKLLAMNASEFVIMTVAIVFLAGFFAWDPAAYKAIVLSVLPRARRPRVHAVLDMSAESMRGWLIGQSVSMVVIFVFTLAALMLVGMPNPILLAVQAGLLTFIPTLGPFVAGSVIILAGLSQSFTMAAYGLITYLVIQFLETHMVTPVVQKRTVRLPPAATLGMQIIATAVFGLPGVILAVPATAAIMTLVRELYVQDCLGGPWRAPQSSDD
jgi:predicted PurR-regulated permease PerM